MSCWARIFEIAESERLLSSGLGGQTTRCAECISAKLNSRPQEIQLYLLQLVQALKFESSFSAADSLRSSRTSRHRRKMSIGDGEDSGLSQLLIDRAAADPVLGTALHWYLMIEVNNRTSVGKMYGKVAYRFQEKLQEVSRVMSRMAVLTMRVSKREGTEGDPSTTGRVGPTTIDSGERVPCG